MNKKANQRFSVHSESFREEFRKKNSEQKANQKIRGLFNPKKKAVSAIIAYVLLITITLAISTMIYSWLRFYVSPGKEVKCPEGASLIIKNYNYDCSANKLNISLQNKGLFTIDGFILRVSDRQNASLGIYILNKIEEEMEPGETFNQEYSTNEDMTGKNIVYKLTFMEVQPFISDDNMQVLCERIATQVLTCP